MQSACSDVTARFTACLAASWLWFTRGSQLALDGFHLQTCAVVPARSMQPVNSWTVCRPTLVLLCLPGRFDIWDIFSSRAAGCVELTALYQPSRAEVPVQEVEAEAATMTATTAAAASTEPEHDREEQELLSKLSELAQQEDTADMSAGTLLSCTSYSSFSYYYYY